MKIAVVALMSSMLLWAGSVSSADDCGAAAQAREGKIMPTGDTFATFSVRAKPCPDGCSGWVDFRIHYLNKNGNKHFYSSSVEWESDQGEPVEVSKDGYESHCRNTNLGPCDVMGTEIVKVSCRH
jgi:hypothetical protein